MFQPEDGGDQNPFEGFVGKTLERVVHHLASTQRYKPESRKSEKRLRGTKQIPILRTLWKEGGRQGTRITKGIALAYSQL
jgi:hypothetical protein